LCNYDIQVGGGGGRVYSGTCGHTGPVVREYLKATVRNVTQRAWWVCVGLCTDSGAVLFALNFNLRLRDNVGFGGLGVACWPLVPKFPGSNPAEAFGFLGRKKILSTPSEGVRTSGK